jgi:hypothetical protein
VNRPRQLLAGDCVKRRALAILRLPMQVLAFILTALMLTVAAFDALSGALVSLKAKRGYTNTVL